MLAYYKVEDKLYGMPFNTSSSILYYNKDAFRRPASIRASRPRRTTKWRTTPRSW